MSHPTVLNVVGTIPFGQRTNMPWHNHVVYLMSNCNFWTIYITIATQQTILGISHNIRLISTANTA
jgi:hypothetical protein